LRFSPAAFLLLFGLSGCTPSIGDKCVLSTDCSIRGDRICDNAQPGGYCTQLNCGGNLCPDKAACVLFNQNVPGCPYDDRSPSRTGRSYCMKTCESRGDCREGYDCRDPKGPPYNAAILDDGQNVKICVAFPSDRSEVSSDAGADAGIPAVCLAVGPDAGTIDASRPEGGTQNDAGADGGDAGDAGDAGIADAADEGG
jgi:hypothetical protein